MRAIANINNQLKGDRWIWIILILLSISSILAVYSASAYMQYRPGGSSTEWYLIKQVMILAMGFGIAYYIQSIHYTVFGKLAAVLLVGSIVLLAYTIFFGVEIHQARRWVRVPIIGMSIQSSEIAKFSLIIYVASKIAVLGHQKEQVGRLWVELILPICLVCGLIMPSDFSTAAMLFFSCFAIMWVGKVDYRFLATAFLLITIIAFALLAFGTFFSEIRSQTWINRFVSFFTDTGDTYQITQSKIAIAEGGWTGEGPGNSVQRNFLPYPYADFIYAIICEEYGILGGGFVTLLYMSLLARILVIVTRTRKKFAALLTVGIGLSIVLQALLNIAVSVDMVPVTGLNLPIISKGGTSTIIHCIAIGMVLSVSQCTENQIKEEQKEDHLIEEENEGDEIDH